MIKNDIHSYVLTTNGFKNIKEITNSDFIVTTQQTTDKIINVQTTNIQRLSNYSLLQNSIDDLKYIVFNKTKIKVFDNTYNLYNKEIQHIQKDDWLYHPWVNREQIHFDNIIDLSKTSTNFYDSKFIYLFNNSILDISKKLNIPRKAVEQILICENKDYEEYLPDICKYIYDTYNIRYDPLESETSFKEFKIFVKNNFVFKMKRFINIDKNFASFVLATIRNSKINKTTLTDDTYLYELKLKFNTILEKDLLTSTTLFLKELGVKFKVGLNGSSTFVNIYNKPLFDFVNNLLLKNISCIVNSNTEVQKYFISQLFQNKQEICVPLSVAIQIKELFLYYKKIISIKDNYEEYKISEITDDFDNLISNLIIEEKGYYSKVTQKLPFNKLYEDYYQLSIKDKQIVHLGFTEQV